MKNKIFISALVLSVLFISFVNAYDFDPARNITLQNLYSINNGVNAHFAYYYGDGSALTGITAAGDSGEDKWVDGGTYIYPNSTYADNVIVYGYMKAHDWTNVSITESQVSDLGTYRLQLWDNFTGIPIATPSNGDTTHLSTANQIYDFVISLGYATTTYVDSIGNWSDDKSSYWDSSTDLDTVISADEIAESKIAFDTACGAGNHYYLNGNDLACEADDDTTYTASAGLVLTDTTFTHKDSSSQVSSDNSARTYIQDIILDTYGHITSITTAAETVTDTSANTVCSGGTTYMDGDGGCDDISSVYEAADATLTDIADGTINENLVNTAHPWTDNEVSDTLTCSNLVSGSAVVDISTETNLAVGNGITLTDDTLTVTGGTAITADAGGVSVTAGTIGDTQLAFNTGQHLATTNSPTFQNVTVEEIHLENDATNHRIYDNTTHTFICGDTSCIIIG